MPRVLLLLLATLLAFGCGGKKGSAIATLTKKDGPVDRQKGTDEWKQAEVGTEFFIGDAARTADGGANLEVIGGAQIAMQPHTILRFGGKDGNSKIAVELGAIDLTGSGNYALDGGDVKLSKGTVRISAKAGGKNTIELTIGEATVSSVDGGSISLEVGKVFDLDLDVKVTTIDAGVADAAVVVDAPIDAPEVAQSDEGTIEVTGKKAEILAPGETAWKPLPAGAGVIAKGTAVRLGNGTTAKLSARGTAIEMAGGSRAKLGDDSVFSIEAGVVRASAAGKAEGKIAIPGGAVALESTPSGSEVRTDVNSRETRVTDTRGAAKLTGSGGGELEMNRGETATLAKNGTIRVIEAIPGYFDFRLAVGETVTIHDPKGATAVQFSFGGKCSEGGFIEMDRDARFRTAKISGGKDQANLAVGAGSWAYRLRCTTASGDSAAVGSGRIALVRDAGTRTLLKPVTNDIDTDGRNYSLGYQSSIPNFAVRIKGEGGPFVLHMATGGAEESFSGPGPKITVPGEKLKEGTYSYWIDRNGVKDPKVSTLKIYFDNTAPQVYIQSPQNGKAWGEGDIDVRGAVLPGWQAAVEGVAIPMDKQLRFTAKVARPAGKALAIKLSHPKRGTHYYVRRGS
ncbi:MAG: hypothetical protein ABI175_22640 [Polyangiales bacterium]